MTQAQLQELHALTIAMGLRECIIESRNNGRFPTLDLAKEMYWLERRLKEVGRLTYKPRTPAELHAFFLHISSAVDIIHNAEGVNFLRFVTAVEEVVHSVGRTVPPCKRPAWQALLDALASLHEAYDPILSTGPEINKGLEMGSKLLQAPMLVQETP